MSSGKILLLVFLAINAIQDVRKKEILLIPTIVYGFCTLWWFLLSGYDSEYLLGSCLPGLVILVVSITTAGQVGLGDAWILLVMGLQLGFFSTVGLLWGTLLLMMVISLGWLLSGKYPKQKKATLPMVPFLFVITLIWQLVCQ